ncbi:hypothetical protein BDN72DRAFT_904068 [Pluteus cervinus]|uniref:Uncharacterized protein n=1 Tax=Pluteus cervinus TaxID=181527 RepID=A0ACD3A7E9_9AGAR|nr:hypothetical protein BDN72DRAFT_904068 [Pluteus cervinus]
MRWDRNDEKPGSAFHELIVLPTFAPELARPEYMDPRAPGPVILPQPRSQQRENGIYALNDHIAVAGPGIAAGPQNTINVDLEQDTNPLRALDTGEDQDEDDFEGIHQQSDQGYVGLYSPTSTIARS